MDKVRERIREYITKGVIKTEGLRKLKREFKIDSDKLSSMWLEEKENIKQKHSKTSKKKIKNEEVKKVEKPIIMKPTEEKKSNLEVTSMTIKGQYADYIRDGDKVICGEEVFYSIDDLEEYKKKEIANFYARLGEIYEVFELEVR